MSNLPPIILLAEDSGVGSVIFWSLVLIGLLFAGFFAVSWLRRWLQSDDETPVGVGFSLSDLRELRKRGQISEEEYERARTKMVGAAKEMAAKLPDPLARNRRPGSELRQRPPQE